MAKTKPKSEAQRKAYYSKADEHAKNDRAKTFQDQKRQSEGARERGRVRREVEARRDEKALTQSLADPWDSLDD